MNVNMNMNIIKLVQAKFWKNLSNMQQRISESCTKIYTLILNKNIHIYLFYMGVKLSPSL